jgi:integrase
MPLTQKLIADAIAASKTTKAKRHADGRSLYLVARNGRGFWIWMHANDNGGKSPQSVGLGPYPETTLAAARIRRDDYAGDRRRRLQGGVTMAAIRPTAGAGELFAKAASTYLADHAPEWTPRHAAGLASLIKNYAGPLAAKHVNAITTADIKTMLAPIWNGPGDNKGSRLRHLVESILGACDVDPNPAAWVRVCRVLHKEAAPVVGKASMPYADLPAYVATLGNDVESRATLFTILTGIRRKEALGARWGEFDFANNVWHIPAERMKGKKGKKVMHHVPLTPEMIACIGTPGAPDSLLFPATRSGGVLPSGACSIKAQGATLHGFRTSFTTWAQEQDGGRKYPDPVIDAALAHKLTCKVMAAYFRSDHFEARVGLMSAWNAFVMSGR